MTDEKHRVLQMLSSGKINVDEAAELLQALESSAEAAPPASSAGEGDGRRARWLRLTLHKKLDGGLKKEISLRVPATLVRAGVRLGSLLPFGGAGFVVGKKDNFAKLDQHQLDELLNSMGEMTIDLDGKAEVRVWCE
jgi:SHOCT-like protein